MYGADIPEYEEVGEMETETDSSQKEFDEIKRNGSRRADAAALKEMLKKCKKRLLRKCRSPSLSTL